jgi:hypothetical protein
LHHSFESLSLFLQDVGVAIFFELLIGERQNRKCGLNAVFWRGVRKIWDHVLAAAGYPLPACF